jgi:hypothetical protein
MSAYLRQLAERLVAPRLAIRPRRPARFEGAALDAEPGVASIPGHVPAMRSATAAPPALAHDTPEAGHRMAPPTAAPVMRDEPALARAAGATPAPRLSAAGESAPPAMPGLHDDGALAGGAPRSAGLLQTPGTLLAERRPERPASETRPQVVNTATAVDEPASPWAGPRDALSPSVSASTPTASILQQPRLRALEPESKPPLHPSPGPDVEPGRPHPAPGAAGQPAPEPVVQVTIGHIEVRAPAPAPAPPQRRAPSSARRSLDDYLQARSRGRRP